MSNLFSKIFDGKKFTFQPFEFGNKSGYHIDVNEEEGTRWEFSMLHSDAADATKMKIEETNLPAWIMHLQASLIKAINEEG